MGGGREKTGGETKILKRGDKLGQGVGALKRGPGMPLRTMEKKHKRRSEQKKKPFGGKSSRKRKSGSSKTLSYIQSRATSPVENQRQQIEALKEEGSYLEK